MLRKFLLICWLACALGTCVAQTTDGNTGASRLLRDSARVEKVKQKV